jgi:hypothetical protein
VPLPDSNTATAERGLKRLQIAEEFSITERTVDRHAADMLNTPPHSPAYAILKSSLRASGTLPDPREVAGQAERRVLTLTSGRMRRRQQGIGDYDAQFIGDSLAHASIL